MRKVLVLQDNLCATLFVTMQHASVKSCVKAQLTMYTFDLWAGFCTRLACNQDKLSRGSCVCNSNIHSAEHACRDSIAACSRHDIPYNTHNRVVIFTSHGYCSRVLYRQFGMQKCGYYSRVVLIQDYKLYACISLSCRVVRSDLCAPLLPMYPMAEL